MINLWRYCGKYSLKELFFLKCFWEIEWVKILFSVNSFLIYQMKQNFSALKKNIY